MPPVSGLCGDTLIAGVDDTGHGHQAVPGASFPDYVGTMTTCDFCGRQEADDAATLTWSTAVENGRAKTYCDRCSREHLRAMEGKLDSEYW